MRNNLKTELVIKNIQTALSEVKPEYKTMLKNIDKNMPMVQQASSNFYKSHSQFMGVTLDVTAITPIRSIKHTLAEVDKTKNALQPHLKDDTTLILTSDKLFCVFIDHFVKKYTHQDSNKVYMIFPFPDAGATKNQLDKAKNFLNTKLTALKKESLKKEKRERF